VTARILERVFKNAFIPRFVLFFGFGLAFSKLIRPERRLHGWSFWEWEASNLNYFDAVASIAAWLLGIIVVAAISEYRRSRRRTVK
jgi:hypothetical protein